MQISKKQYTTLIIAVLTISTLIAAIPMASAISTSPTLYETPPVGPPSVITTGGPVGSKVSVVGTVGAGDASPFSTVTAYWDSLSGKVLGTKSADVNGEYRIDVTIPPAVFGTHYIVVNDGAGAQGAPYDVEPALTVNTVPPYPAFMTPQALPGDSLTIAGHGYAANDDITLFLNQTTDPTISYVITTPEFTTNATGSFSGTFIVPDIPMANFDDYEVNATDEAANSAVDTVTIDYYIVAMPASGPTGITVSIMGRIAADTAYQIRFNAAPIASGTTDATGFYLTSYTIPGVLGTGSYPVDIIWETVNSRATTFTVTPTPTITLGATTGIAGETVTIDGQDFTALADITLYFGTTVVNSTELDDRFGPTSWMPVAGTFSEDFVVPSLTPGVYSVTVVDENGATSTAVLFTILAAPETTVELRGTTYYPMDIFSFNIYTTEASLGVITVSVRDPSGMLWWKTDDWTLTDFVVYKTVIFQDQGADDYNQMRMMLPADAPIGTWNWTITYTPTSTGKLTKATGLFIVNPRPTMATVIDEIDELGTNMTELLDGLDAKIVAIDDAIASIEIPELGTITTSLSSLDSKITSISGNMATVQTSLGTVQTTVESLDVVVGSLYGDVVTLQTAVGAVQTSVDNLDATVTSIEDGVATIDTNFGTLEGTITEMEGDIATVQTDVGTLKVDVADVKTNVGSVKTTVDDSLPVTVDMMPVWIAVILSLIAAIAAIFAVITIRQKIAG